MRRSTNKTIRTKNAFKQKYIKEEIFIISILVVPVLWWALGFFYTTFDSVKLAFYKFDIDKYQFVPVGLENIIQVSKDLFSSGSLLGICFKNSFTLWALNICIVLPISLFISFALYKKMILSNFFKVILFLPHIITSMVWIIAFQFLSELSFPQVVYNGVKVSMLISPDTNLFMMYGYQLWISLASSMIIYTGAMSRISPELVEAGQLEGMSPMREFFSITLPLIFSTVSVVLITFVIGIFTSTLPTYQFYGDNAPLHLWTFGHYMLQYGKGQTQTYYPIISAISLIVTVVAAPITLTVRYLLEKFGPETEG